MTTEELPSEEAVRAYGETLSNWGRFGPDDRLGTLNFIGSDEVAAAARTVSEGTVVALGRKVETSARTYNRNSPPYLHHMINDGRSSQPGAMFAAVDWIGLGVHGHELTHLDAPSHMVFDQHYYNGRSATDATEAEVAEQLSIEIAAGGIVGRGVLLDVPRSAGVDWLTPGTPVTPSMLDQCARDEGLQIDHGDLVFLRVGIDAVPGEEAAARAGARAGWHVSCLPWVREHDVALVASEGANDVSPSGYPIRFPFHAFGIVAMGLWLIDNTNLEELAAACARRGCWSFLTSVAPLDLEGATGCPVNPIAVL